MVEHDRRMREGAGQIDEGFELSLEHPSVEGEPQGRNCVETSGDVIEETFTTIVRNLSRFIFTVPGFCSDVLRYDRARLRNAYHLPGGSSLTFQFSCQSVQLGIQCAHLSTFLFGRQWNQLTESAERIFTSRRSFSNSLSQEFGLLFTDRSLDGQRESSD
jgi:hypothetical protein